MEIFPYCIRTSIPKTNSFHHFVADRIIWNWEGKIKEWERICNVNKTMDDVMNSSDHGDIKIVSGEDLRWLEHYGMTICIIIDELLFENLEVKIWCPRVCVKNCEEYLIWVNHSLLEIWFKMFCTPWDIRSFTFLFMLSNFMSCILNNSKFIFESAY